jgi:purine nucleosidase
MAEDAEARRSVVVDTDPGIDDAMALLYLAGRDDIDIAAVTTVYGNTTIEHALSNTARVLSLAGLAGTLVARGASAPITGSASIATPVHGPDGLGGLWSDAPEPANLSPLHAAELLVALGHAEPLRHHLIALGPLTNLGHALAIDPDLLTRFRTVTVMAGSGAFGAPATTLSADSNVQNDPEAARRVFSAPRSRLLSVGVDVTVRAVIDESMTAFLRESGSPRGIFSADILDAYNDFYRFAWGRRVSPAHDGLTVALAIHPSWVLKTSSGPVNVLSDGYSTRARLMQLPDGAPPALRITPAPPTDVVVEADTVAFLADFVRVLSSG